MRYLPSFRAKGTRLTSRLSLAYSVVAIVVTLLASASGSPLTAQERSDAAAEKSDPVRRKFLQINFLFNRGLYDLAIPEYEKFLAENPKFGDLALAQYAVALCHYKLATADEKAAESEPAKARRDKHLRAGIRYLKDAIRNRRFSRRAEATRLLGQCLLASGDERNAVKAFRWSAENAKNAAHRAAAQLGLGEAHYVGNRHAEAASIYREIIREGKASADDLERARFYLAMSLRREGSERSVADSLGIFRELASSRASPFQEDSAYMAALLLSESGRDAEAVGLFESLAKKKDGEHARSALFWLGKTLVRTERYDAAIVSLEDFSARYPRAERFGEARLLLARAHSAKGARDAAIAVLGDLTDSQAVGDQASLALARELAQSDAASATRVLTKAIETFPESPILAELELELGSAALNAGEFALAADRFAAFAAKRPEYSALDHVRYLEAYALHRGGKPTQSRAACRAFRGKFAESEYLGNVLELEAENGFQMGDFAGARQAYGAYLSRAGDALDAAARFQTRMRIAQTYYQEGSYPEAVRVFDDLKPPRNPATPLARSYHYYLGDAAYQSGDYARAATELASYLAVIRSAPASDRAELAQQTDDAAFKIGHAAQLAKRFDDARARYREALEQNPKSRYRERISFELGQIAYERKDFGAAKRDFGALLDAYPESSFAAHALFYLGAIEQDASEPRRAASYFQRIVDAHAGSAVEADATFRLALCLREAGDDEAAQAILKRFQTKFPDDERLGRVRLEEAAALAKSGQAERALAELSVLLDDPALASERARVRYEIAWCYRRLERPDDAAATYRKLLEEKGAPDGEAFQRTVQLELAELEFERKNYAETKKLLAPLANLDGAQQPDVLYRLAWSHHLLGEPKDTVGVFETFAAKHTKNDLYPEIAFLAAKSLLTLEQVTKAGELFRSIAAQFPEAKETELALVSYGECLVEDRKFTEGQKIFAGFVRRYPKSDVLYRAQFGLGWCLENQGSIDAAEKSYRAVVAATNTPTGARAQFQIGQCLVAKKDYKKAVVEFLKIPPTYPYDDWSAKALLQVAGCFEALDEPGRAEEYYREVSAKYPDGDEAKLAAERLRKLETR